MRRPGICARRKTQNTSSTQLISKSAWPQCRGGLRLPHTTEGGCRRHPAGWSLREPLIADARAPSGRAPPQVPDVGGQNNWVGTLWKALFVVEGFMCCSYRALDNQKRVSARRGCRPQPYYRCIYDHQEVIFAVSSTAIVAHPDPKDPTTAGH